MIDLNHAVTLMMTELGDDGFATPLRRCGPRVAASLPKPLAPCRSAL